MKLIKTFLIIFSICATSTLSIGQELERYDTFAAFEKNVLKGLDQEKQYIINFWATWCKPCVAELPYFESITADPDDNVEVILVSLDFKNQIDSRLMPFIEKHELKSRVILLADGKYNSWIDKVDASWSGAIPATLFVKEGKSHFVEGDFHSKEEILQQLHSQ